MIGFAVERDGFIFRSPSFLSRVQKASDVVPIELTQLWEKPATRLLAHSKNSLLGNISDKQTMPDKHMQKIMQYLQPELTLFYSYSPGLIEAGHYGITKASGLQWLGERYGFSRDDVVAFSNSDKDIPILRWARTSVAMSNATPNVLAITKHITCSSEEDGVGVWLEQF